MDSKERLKYLLKIRKTDKQIEKLILDALTETIEEMISDGHLIEYDEQALERLKSAQCFDDLK